MYVSTERPSEAAVLMGEVFCQVASGDIHQSLVTGVANNHRTFRGYGASPWTPSARQWVPVTWPQATGVSTTGFRTH